MFFIRFFFGVLCGLLFAASAANGLEPSGIPFVGSGLSSQVALGANNLPLIVEERVGGVFLLRETNGFWSQEQIANTTSSLTSLQLLNLNDSLYVFFSNSSGAFSASKTVSGWNVVQVSSELGVRLGSGEVCGSEFCFPSMSGAKLGLLRGSDSTWSSQTLYQATDSLKEAKLRVGASGQLAVVYSTEARETLVLGTEDSGAWDFRELSYLHYTIKHSPSLSFDNAGNLYLSSKSEASGASHVFFGVKTSQTDMELARVGFDFSGGQVVLEASSFGDAVVFSGTETDSGLGLRRVEWSSSGVFNYSSALSSASLLESPRDLQVLEDRWGGQVIYYRDSSQGTLLRADDQDRDGIPDAREALYGTSVDNPDTDGDGVWDADELFVLEKNPLVNEGGQSDSNGSDDNSDEDSSGQDGPDQNNSGEGSSNDSSGDSGEETNSQSEQDDIEQEPTQEEELDDLVESPELPPEEVPQRLCGEWNGFFGSLWNILELRNQGAQPAEVTAKLYSLEGREVSQSSCSIQAGGQCDLLVHDLEGRLPDSYGLVCLEHSAPAKDISAQMVYYLLGLGSRDFQFAFAMPLQFGKPGKQVVGFNTFHPSFLPEDQNNLVANWLQLTNNSSSVGAGTIRQYDLQGEEIYSERVTLAAGSRFDFPAHQVGSSNYGMIVWEPEDNYLTYNLRMVKYLYDNPGSQVSFDTAFQLEATQGFRGAFSLPVDNSEGYSVLEFINPASEAIDVTVELFSSDGEALQVSELTLGAKSTLHWVPSQVPNLGNARISSSEGDFVATVMQYQWREDGSVESMYGLNIGESHREQASSSWNTFLGQESELVIVNPTSAAIELQLEVLDDSANTFPLDVLSGTGVLELSPNSQVSIPLSTVVPSQAYGQVKINSGSQFVAWLLRKKPDNYVMPTAFRE